MTEDELVRRYRGHSIYGNELYLPIRMLVDLIADAEAGDLAVTDFEIFEFQGEDLFVWPWWTYKPPPAGRAGAVVGGVPQRAQRSCPSVLP